MPAPTGDVTIDIAILKRQKEVAASGARLEAMQKMVARFRGISRREKELNNESAETETTQAGQDRVRAIAPGRQTDILTGM